MKYKSILKGYKKIFETIERKNHNPNLTRVENTQNAIDAIGRIINQAESNGYPKDEASLMAIAIKALIDDMNNTLVHYFIADKSLIKFLKETEIKDSSIVKDFIFENRTDIHQQTGYYSIAIHTEDEAYVFTYLQNDDRTVVTCIDDDSGAHFQLGSKVDNPIARLSVNILYYMKCFPEKVSEGIPRDMIKNDKKKYSGNKCHSIGIADEIVDKTEVIDGREVIPHFRSGFFRHYTDERYINMKGKVQFIAATMVKGKKAKTLEA